MKARDQYFAETVKQYLPLDAAYPERLRTLANAPDCLYVNGSLPPDDMPTLAIIGARNASAYGLDVAKTFAKLFAKRGIGIVSGMANGIDAAAHKGAVEAAKEAYAANAAGTPERHVTETAVTAHAEGKRGACAGFACMEAVQSPAPTYAVLGCGINICYPSRNFLLMEGILKTGGGVLSEYPLDTPPYKSNFVQRNRIIAALSDAVLVVEAREHSGTSITVEYALELGKQVFALPGRITDGMSAGCNRLIREGAELVMRPEDILEFFHYQTDRQTEILQKDEMLLDKSQKVLYSCLDFKVQHLDHIMTKCTLPVQEVLPALTALELLGFVECTTPGYYRKCMEQR